MIPLLLSSATALTAAPAQTPAFWVRPGYKVEVVAEGLGNARFVEFDSQGRLYLSRPNSGDILTLVRGRNGRYTQLAAFVEGYRGKGVHGMHFANGWLWFTESGAVHRARDTNGDGKADEVVNVLKDLPRGGHWWRPILVTPNAFYTEVGDSGNITDEVAGDRQKVWRYSLDGKSRALFASGLRNTEKLRFRPGTTEIWGADHGSDNFGSRMGERPRNGTQPITDRYPPCEFNKIVEGGFYGHPFLVGDRVPRPEYQNRPDILELAAKTTPPAWSFGAHWAPNGFAFLTKTALGADYKGDALVAMHGSWNRTDPAGYRVERVLFDEATGMPFGAQMLVGTIVAGKVLARPVDVTEEPDGGVLFTDDSGGKIFRITRK